MKIKDSAWDCSKKEFYQAVKDRKDEVEDILAKAKESKGYVDFDVWYSNWYDWGFLKDILGGQKKMGLAPFDYNNLIHLPVITYTDADGEKVQVVLSGEHSPQYYGFISGSALVSTDGSLKIEKKDANSELNEDDKIFDFSVDANKVASYIDGYAVNKYLHTNASTGELEWKDITTPIVDNVIQWDDSTKELFKGSEGAYTIVDDIKLGDKTVLNRLNDKLNVPGNAPGTTEPYRLPYYFYTDVKADSIDAHAMTLKLDNSGQTEDTYKLTINAATDTTAGLMTASDKVKLETVDNKLDKVTSSTTDQVYVALRDGTQSTVTLTTNDTGNAAVRRLSNANIVVPETPGATNNAASKKYVDDSIATTKSYVDNNFVKITGSTMSGSIDMGSKSIINLAEPTNNSDASTKKYVDDSISALSSRYLGSYDAGQTRASAIESGATWPSAAKYTEIINRELATYLPTVTPQNNDYVFLNWTEPVHEYDRCKYSSEASQWVYEYTVYSEVTFDLETELKALSGYDATKVQILYNNKGTIEWRESDPEYEGLKFTSQQDSSTVGYIISGTLSAVIQTSTDGSTWTTWDGTAKTLNNGEYIYVRNTQDTLSTSGFNYLKFTMSGKIAASGNCNSMINYAALSDYCYQFMFQDCTSLTQAPALPAETLADSCYQYMFNGCTSLTQAPALPAVTLYSSCYSSMFNGCTSLTQAPALPAGDSEGTLADECYHWMFYGCTSLTQAPALPAETLATYCYSHMFSGCTSLKVNENGTTGTTIFTCPSTIPSDAVNSMFEITGGTFTGTPTAGNTYKWYE